MDKFVDYDEFHGGTGVQNKIIREDNFTYRLILESLNKYIKPGSKVLDIGCGAGTLDFYLASKGHAVLGIDISGSVIKSASKSAKALGLNSKFEVINFPDKSPKGKFDFIIFTEVIEHLKDDKKALKIINGLLNKNGIVLISTPSKNAPLNKIGYAKGFDKRVGHLRRYDTSSLIKLCEQSGLEVLEARKIEGVIRNFLFLSPVAGKLVRFVKFYASDVVTFMDDLTIPVLGESNIIIVAKKL